MRLARPSADAAGARCVNFFALTVDPARALEEPYALHDDGASLVRGRCGSGSMLFARGDEPAL
jgi:hypothetical protein